MKIIIDGENLTAHNPTTGIAVSFEGVDKVVLERLLLRAHVAMEEIGIKRDIVKLKKRRDKLKEKKQSIPAWE